MTPSRKNRDRRRWTNMAKVRIWCLALEAKKLRDERKKRRDEEVAFLYGDRWRKPL